jgi:lipopolysaccharide biosynthesis glycosyltransferase
MDDNKKYAYATLVMKEDRYVPGALTLGYSFKKHKTKHTTICMHTPDVSKDAIAKLKIIFDKVFEVPYIEHESIPMKSKKQREIYTWDSVSYTKWNVLKFDDYDKILFIDADTLVLQNIDFIFMLSAPAGIFFDYYANGKRKTPFDRLRHGQEITDELCWKLFEKYFVQAGGFVLLEPNRWEFSHYLKMLNAKKPYGHLGCPSIHGNQSLLEFTLLKKKTWTNIHPSYLWIPRKNKTLLQGRKPKVYHYSGTNPWESERGRFKDMTVWWECNDEMLKLLKDSENGTKL